MTAPRTFWCIDCDDLTLVEEPTEQQVESGVGAYDEFWCGRCGGDYQCDECGYEIDRDGNCLRPTETGGCPSQETS
jgi:hypothetical protein